MVATSVKVTMDALKYIAKIGVPQSLYDWLKASPIEAKLTSTCFRFLCDAPGVGEIYEEVPVTVNQLELLKGGLLPVNQKAALGKALADKIGQLQFKMGEAYGEATAVNALIEIDASDDVYKANADLYEEKPKVGFLSQLPKLAVSDEAPAPASNYPAFEKGKLQTAPVVKLRDAKFLYQPVAGSSHGSRYFMVAANKDVRVAARLRDGSLSIRIEGPNWEKFKYHIAASGFDNINPGKGYASLHLSVGTDMMLASKTFGAVLMGLGIQMDTPLPNLAVIAE